MEGHAKLGPRVRVLCWMSSYRHERESRATTYRQLAQESGACGNELVRPAGTDGGNDGRNALPCELSTEQLSYGIQCLEPSITLIPSSPE